MKDEKSHSGNLFSIDNKNDKAPDGYMFLLMFESGDFFTGNNRSELITVGDLRLAFRMEDSYSIVLIENKRMAT